MNKTDLLIAAIAISPTAILTSCDDDDKEPEIPVVDCVTVKDNTVAPGDTVKAELKLKFQGKYVKVTYAYATSPSVGSGQFECGSSQDHTSFSIPIASEADTLLANSAGNTILALMEQADMESPFDDDRAGELAEFFIDYLE